MGKARLEAFSDGVIAIILTVMVLEMHVPRGNDLAALTPVLPVFLCYALSFLYIAIYWNNHHHLLHATRSINGRIMWANAHLLFWLSLVPFVTNWMGENHLAPWPTALYGFALLFSALAYTILLGAIVAHEGKDSAVARAVGRDTKGMASLVLYAAGIVFSFIQPWISDLLYVSVAGIWLVPDRRFEPHTRGGSS